MNSHRSRPRSSYRFGHRDLLRAVSSWCAAAFWVASRTRFAFNVSSFGSKLKPDRKTMSDWNSAIAKYLAVNEESRGDGNIFAKLNAIRCEFAVRNGHGSYVALRNDGSKEMVYIHWQFFEIEGLVMDDIIRHSAIEMPTEQAASRSKPSPD
jgi:hypothetical protein